TPPFAAVTANKRADASRAPPGRSGVGTPRDPPKAPFPPVPPADARTGLIAADDRAWRHRRADFVGLWLGGFSAAAQDRVDAAFAQFDSAQVAHRLSDPLVAQMLLLLVVNDSGLQAGPQMEGQRPPLPTARTR